MALKHALNHLADELGEKSTSYKGLRADLEEQVTSLNEGDRVEITTEGFSPFSGVRYEENEMGYVRSAKMGSRMVLTSNFDRTGLIARLFNDSSVYYEDIVLIKKLRQD